MMTVPKTDAFEYHELLKRLADMTAERDALVRVKISLVDKVEMLERLLADSSSGQDGGLSIREPEFDSPISRHSQAKPLPEQK